MDERLESPYERVKRLGLRSVGAADLLSIAVSSGPERTSDHLEEATGLLKRRGINEIANLGPTDLLDAAELDDFRALQLICAIEIGRRSGLSAKGETKIISSPKDAAKLFAYLEDEKREHFCALFLNSKNGVICTKTIHIGTVDTSVVGAREVFREAIREGAVTVIVVHNHPSGDPEPSPQDISVTDSLCQAGELLGIPVVDHIIIGHNRFVSLNERNCI